MLISHGRANVFLRTVAVMRTQFLWWTCKNSGVSGPVVARVIACQSIQSFSCARHTPTRKPKCALSANAQCACPMFVVVAAQCKFARISIEFERETCVAAIA